MAMTYFCINNVEKIIYPFKQEKIRKVSAAGVIKEMELMKSGSLRFTAEIKSMSKDVKKVELGNNFLVRIYDEQTNLDSIYDRLKIGSEFEITGTIQKGRGERNPGEFDYQKYLVSKEISGLINCYNVNEIKVFNGESNNYKNIIFETRKAIDKRIKQLHSPTTAALLKGLLLADRGDVDFETREMFVNSGVIHVLAVSGLHVGFIVLIFLFLFTRLNIYLRYIFTIVGLLLFVVITNSPPSVFRASIMSIIVIISLLSNRSYNTINALAFAAFVLLIINPNELFNPGFQLSFSAVLSIVIIYPRIKSLLNGFIINKYIKGVLLFMGVSLSAQIGTLPFTLIYFNKLSVISLLANLVVIPLIGVIVGIGIFTLTVSSFWSWLTIVYASANDFFAFLLFEFVRLTGSLKFSFIPIYKFSLIDGIIFYLIAAFALYFWKYFKSALAKIVFLLFVVANFYLFISFDNNKLLPDGKLSVVTIDIGQGDGILIKFPNNKTALIDAGNATPYFDNGKSVISPLLKRLGIEKIDYAFVSHVDSDHYKGFFSLIKEGFIKRIIKPKIDSTLQRDIVFEKFIKENGIKIDYYSKSILNFGNARLYMLNDTTNFKYNLLNVNDKSGIIKLVHGNNEILFVGDAGIKTEELLVNDYGEFLQSDILKAGHHGSKTSSGEMFLDYVKPNTALISAGIANKFKHPSKEVVERFKSRKIKIYRTDKEGAIIIISDGESFKKIDWKN
jgi:competence protein ComEC